MTNEQLKVIINLIADKIEFELAPKVNEVIDENTSREVITEHLVSGKFSERIGDFLTVCVVREFANEIRQMEALLNA